MNILDYIDALFWRRNLVKYLRNSTSTGISIGSTKSLDFLYDNLPEIVNLSQEGEFFASVNGELFYRFSLESIAKIIPAPKLFSKTYDIFVCKISDFIRGDRRRL